MLTECHPIMRPVTAEIVYRIYSSILRKTKHPGIGDPLNIYSVDLDSVTHIAPGTQRGFIHGGDWDISNNTKIEDWFRYTMFHKHFIDGKPWEEIEEYKSLEETLEQKGEIGTLDMKKGEQSKNSLFRYHRYIDDLYDNIKADGYKKQRDLDRTDDFCNRNIHPSLNEIQVKIGRDGSIMPHTGYHRLAIAKILDIDSIPVRTSVRHTEWQSIRDTIYSSCDINKLNTREKEHVQHPELDDISVTSETTDGAMKISNIYD